MKADVIRAFYDLEHPENVYQPGDVFEGTAARVNGLAEKGFVKKRPSKRRASKPKED